MSRPYPWKCRMCGQPNVSPVTVDYSTEMEHDGISYSLTVPSLEILECTACHNQVFPDQAFEKLLSKLRSEAGLLTPEEIKTGRTVLKLTQEQLASHLKVARETVSRWESGGQIQQRAYDTLIRLYFQFEDVRTALENASKNQPMVEEEKIAEMSQATMKSLTDDVLSTSLPRQ